MSDESPFEPQGLPQDDSATTGLPFAPSPAAPPLPFAVTDEAPPMPFAMGGEPAMPPLPFSLDDEVPPVDAGAVPPFSLEAESKIPPLPFSLDDEPALPSAEVESKIPPLPFSLDDEPALPSAEAESKIPHLPFSLDDDPVESPLFSRQAEPAEEPAPEAKPELTGAGFLFEEGEIDSPFFRRLAEQAEAPKPKMMPPMGVPAMPPAAGAAPPPFPPAYEPARPAAAPASPPAPPAASERPMPPPPPGYQPPPPPPPPIMEPVSRPVPPPATTYEPPSPPPVAQPAPYAAPVAEPPAYQPVVPPAVPQAPHAMGDAVPAREAVPVAKDVSSALAAMKARLATTRQSQPDPNADLLKEPAAAFSMDMGLAPKSSKPPEIWDYRVGQSVFREGELTYELFMLMEGIIDIYVGGDKVATLNAETAAGAYIGEIGALLRLPRTATVKAVTSCKFLVFPDAKRLFEEDPEFGIKLSIILAQRLARSNESMEMVMRALYRAKVKDEVISAVKGAFQGKESTYVGKKGWFS